MGADPAAGDAAGGGPLAVAPAGNMAGGGGPLAGATALVTGASRGIGAAIAAALDGAGARVVLAARSRDALERVASGLRHDPVVIEADLADPAAPAALAQRAQAALGGGVDVLVNNAAHAARVPLAELDAALIDRMHAVNVRAPLLLIAALVPGMIARGGGSIVSLSSVSGVVGTPRRSAYAARRPRPPAIDAASRSLAIELGGDGIRVNTSPRASSTPSCGHATRRSRASWRGSRPRPCSAAGPSRPTWPTSSCSSPPTPRGSSPARRSAPTAGWRGRSTCTAARSDGGAIFPSVPGGNIARDDLRGCDPMDLELTDRRAVVTGASRGIGLAVARALAAEGAQVALVARDAEALQRAAAQLSGRAVIAPCDTGDDAAVAAMAAQVTAELGGVDILVNCAAQANTGPMGDDQLDEQLNVKLKGYLRCARAFAPQMAERGWGRIINVSGLAARSTGSVVGSVRNVAVAAMTKNLADEYGADGVNVTVVHPGMTVTEKFADTLERMADAQGTSPEEVEGAFARAVSIGRVVTAEEVADVVAFLASPRSVAITGDAVAAGGGARGSIHY